MFIRRVGAGIVAFLALLVACSEPVQPDPTPDTAAAVEALVATRVAEAVPFVPLTNAKAYYNRGVEYSDLGQHERAIQEYDAAIRLNPEAADAYYNRGVTHEILGNSIEAERDHAMVKEVEGP